MNPTIGHPTSATTPDVPELLQATQDLIVSLDTEYTQEAYLALPSLGITDAPIPKHRLLPNRIISYQWTALDTTTGHTSQHVYNCSPGERLGLGEIIHYAVQDIGISQARLRARGSHAAPLRVMVCWHWGSAEVGALTDRKRLMELQEVIDIGGGVLTLQPVPYPVSLQDRHETYGRILLTLRDTTRLLEAKEPLDKVGEELGLPKIDIAPYSKTRMDVLHDENQALFDAYALRDTEIVMGWICRTATTQREVLNVTHDLAPTTGSASATGFREYLSEDFKSKFCVRYSHPRKEWIPQAKRACNESFVELAFMGGMNQSYRLGRVEGLILDLDLDGAYAGALGILPSIDWDIAPDNGEKDPWKLVDPMCFAGIYFEFPEGTEFPCLPVWTAHGLIYPRTHLQTRRDVQPTFVTGPELHEALLMGAKIKVWDARRFTTNGLLAEGFVGQLSEVRRRYPKGTAQNKAAKLAINSLYGKLGQGLSKRYTNDDIFSDSEIEEGKTMRRSPITLPHAAATVTGLVRAVLNVMVNEASKLGTVLSATTDGFMVCLPAGTDKTHTLDVLKTACERHPAFGLFCQGRENLGLDPRAWLEIKREGTKANTVKTRVNWIGNEAGTVHEVMTGFAKDPADPCYVPFSVLENIIAEHRKCYYTERRLYKISDVIEGKARDITDYYQSKRVNLTPDWKRHFAADGTSKPFDSMGQYWEYRKVVDARDSDAWPELVEYQVSQRIRGTDMLDQAIRRDAMHCIALGMEGFRLPKGTTYKLACQKLGVNEKALTRLRHERPLHAGFPMHHPEVVRIRTLLNLW